MSEESKQKGLSKPPKTQKKFNLGSMPQQGQDQTDDESFPVPPELDPNTGKCVPGIADKYLASVLSEYPSAADMISTSAEAALRVGCQSRAILSVMLSFNLALSS